MESKEFIDIDHTGTDDYVPGVCNIGPAEIERRKQSFYVSALGATVIVVLVWIGAFTSPWNVIVPFVVLAVGIGTGVGYLQWSERFCVAFGLKGVFNFGDLGPTKKIEEDEALKQDRAKVRQIFVKSLGIGFVYLVVVMVLDSILPFPDLFTF